MGNAPEAPGEPATIVLSSIATEVLEPVALEPVDVHALVGGRQLCGLGAGGRAGAGEGVGGALVDVGADVVAVRTRDDRVAVDRDRDAELVARGPVGGRQLRGLRPAVAGAVIDVDGPRAVVFVSRADHEDVAFDRNLVAERVLSCAV